MKIRYIHWKTEEAESRVNPLRKAGVDVDATLPAGPAFPKDLALNPPQAVVIDLTRLPSQGRDMAVLVRKQASTRNIPLIFVDGDPAKVEKIKILLPDAVYTTWDGLLDALRTASEQQPENLVIPDSAFAAYAGRKLVRKLGIKPHSNVLLIDAPPDFQDLLEDLPPNVTIMKSDRILDAHLVIWFTRSKHELLNRVAVMAASLGDASIWIAWPKKASGVKSDLTQQIVRDAGLSNGIVDYKICAIDETWSALQFTRRKKGSH